ncbi:prepilin-type N-terminal cleavage/methylation domain-containing protein [Massilibacterium senegalense]|uniref:prepilin-type N-terminal cleavage/methylation domain-containing protein n=1 Tax=Massilibacterium senegalense TaxID=1632858 RepID=UPI00078616F1|nr:prepilin-type N-terminal cleavage/methylation domain-containing protein [Massilibacterium senegalense]
MKKINNEYGLTLSELLVSVLIGSIFLAVIFIIFLSGYNSYYRTMKENEIRSEADYVMGKIIKVLYPVPIDDIKVSNDTITRLSSNEQFTFKDNKLIYFNKDGSEDIISEQLEHINFSKPDINHDGEMDEKDNLISIKLSLKQSKKRTHTFTSHIALPTGGE